MSRDEKRSKFTETKKSKTGTYFLIGILALGVIVVGAFKFLAKSGVPEWAVNVGQVDYTGQNVDPVKIEIAESNGQIVVDLNKIKSEKMVTFDVPGINFTLENGTPFDFVPILGYVSPKGNVILATSLCEPCSGITFHIEGDQLVCNTCGTRWYLENMQGISGGCPQYPPEMFKYTVQGDKLFINKADLQNWQPRDI